MRTAHTQLRPVRIARAWLRGETGLSTLELALALPMLMVLFCGLIEVGYMYFASATVDKAAQAGARVAVTGEGYDDGTRMDLIRDRIVRATSAFAGKGTLGMEINNLPNGSAAAITSGAGGPCDIVEVNVEYTYAPITPIAGPIFGSAITVHGTDRMINEPWIACD